mgnify:FL=1|jgi:hypothetical protein
MDTKRIIDQYFKMAIFDLENGESIDDLRDLLYDYERREQYEACEGIKRAIDHFRFWCVMDEIKTNDLTDKIQISFEKDEDNN